MKLKDLLKGIDVKNDFENVDVLDVTQDSRLVKDGSLFICIKGAAFDGHSVAKKMLESGAVAVVVDHDLGLDSQILLKIQEPFILLFVLISSVTLPKN